MHSLCCFITHLFEKWRVLGESEYLPFSSKPSTNIFSQQASLPLTASLSYHPSAFFQPRFLSTPVTRSRPSPLSIPLTAALWSCTTSHGGGGVRGCLIICPPDLVYVRLLFHIKSHIEVFDWFADVLVPSTHSYSFVSRFRMGLLHFDATHFLWLLFTCRGLWWAR